MEPSRHSRTHIISLPKYKFLSVIDPKCSVPRNANDVKERILTSVHNSPQTGEMSVVAGFSACPIRAGRQAGKPATTINSHLRSQLCTDVRRIVRSERVR